MLGHGPRIALCTALLLALVPAGAARKDAAQPLLEAEAALQAAVDARGEAGGFLAHTAESAVTFRPKPTPARSWYEGRQAMPSRVRWQPELAAISGDGEFGWTSGPWIHWGSAEGARHSAAGHYLTAWRREADGRWKVVLDARAPYPVTDAERDGHLQTVPRLRRPGGGDGRAQDCSEGFAKLWQDEGREEALDEYAAKDVRLLQTNAPPIDGRKAAARGDRLRDAPLAADRLGRRIASAGGDVVLTYGEYDVAARADAPRARYAYVQAWDVGRRCRLALELIIPVQ